MAACEHLLMNGNMVLTAVLVIVVVIVIIAAVIVFFSTQHTLYCERTFAGNLSAIQDCVAQWG